MEKIKNLNLKKQLLSLKYCYDGLITENKALNSKINSLVIFFKLTKYYTRQKNITNKNFDFNFIKDKNYQTISNKNYYLTKNIDKQNNTLRKSFLFNKYNELMKEKENLIQTLEEKKSNLKSIQKELNLYKINNPYNAYHKFIKLRSAIYLNETLDTSYFVKKNTNEKNYNHISLINNKFKKEIRKEKIDLEKVLEKSLNQLKNLYDYSFYYFSKKAKELGFSSILKNKKNNKTYIISIEANQCYNKNSSDSDSEDNNIQKSNSINERIFFDDFQTNLKKSNKIKYINTRSRYKAETLHFKAIDPPNKDRSRKSEINKNLSPDNFWRNNNIILTEVNIDRIEELNNKLLSIKENYYNCLDKKYQLKGILKQNISQIYKTKEKIKKIKKQRKIKLLK